MIPSLLQIPSAVSDSKLHSVLPNNGKGDFQFERSTGATRINRDGLIEEVGYFSSELVQNGNFSELGSELVTNGDFATDSDWIKGTGWSIANGIATLTTHIASSSLNSTAMTVTSGHTYKIEVDVVSTSSGFRLYDTIGVVSYGLDVGKNIFYRTVSASSYTIIPLGLAGATGSIQNISVKQVDPNDRWTLQNGSIINEGVATVVANGFLSSSGNNWSLYQTDVFETNTKYKVTFKAKQTSGTGVFLLGAGYGQPFNQVITSEFVNYSLDISAIAVNGNLTIGGGTVGDTFEITDISVIEVQGDRPRLSYDITNGVVDSQPHLLLEPSSTNLVTFSEDYSQSSWNKLNAQVSRTVETSPDGNNTNVFNLTGTNANLYVGGTTVEYTISVYIKSNNKNKDKFKLRLGNNISSEYEATNEWIRYAFTSTPTTGVLGITTSSSPNNEFDLLVWGFQLEQQSYATSYIPTAGTTITRAAETCNNSKPSVNSTEGVLYCEIAALADDLTNRDIAISNGTGDNRVFIYYSTTSNQIVGRVRVSNSDVALLTYTLTDETEYAKVALKWKANDFALWIDGSERATDTSGSVFSANTLNVVAFDAGESTNDFYGKVKGLAVYNEALSESQLMQLTGVTASSIYSNFVTRTASFTVEALNEVKKVIDNL